MLLAELYAMHFAKLWAKQLSKLFSKLQTEIQVKIAGNDVVYALCNDLGKALGQIEAIASDKGQSFQQFLDNIVGKAADKMYAYKATYKAILTKQRASQISRQN